MGSTKRRIIVRGKLVSRGPAKRAHYVLHYKPKIPLALIEAKDNTHPVADGMQQGLDYATTLDIPFVFSSNGDGLVFHDRTGWSAAVEPDLGLYAFPSPADLWARYRAWNGLDDEAEQIVLQDYFDDGSGKATRYYQVNAVNAAIEVIAKGQDRVFLVMATGTGKSYTAFQIIWRLWNAGRKKRILFPADHNVLIDQTMVSDFRPFGAAMAKLSTNTKTIEGQDGTKVDLALALDNKRRIDTAFEIYLGLFQAITRPKEARCSNWRGTPKGCSDAKNRAKSVACSISYYQTAIRRTGRWSPLSAKPLTCLQKETSRPEKRPHPAAFPSACFKSGSPGRTRTYDLAINSRVLYQLSYRGSRLSAAGGADNTGLGALPSLDDRVVHVVFPPRLLPPARGMLAAVYVSRPHSHRCRSDD